MRRITKKIKLMSILFAFILVFPFLVFGCKDNDINKKLDLKIPVSITIGSKHMQSWPAMEEVITKFEKKYPNCTVKFEYISGEDELIKRRLLNESDTIDIFTSNNIQSTSIYLDVAYNLLEDNEFLDLSNTNDGLVNNFKYTDAENTLYCIPYGGEMHGLYVNETLLNSLNLSIPTNVTELLNCCEVLYANGYVPFCGSSSGFAQQLLYPSICNRIVNGGNYEKDYKAINDIEDNISEYFREEYTLWYNIVSKNYYDYKRVEETSPFILTKETIAEDFLNIVKNENKEYEKQDDIGKIAFMTETQAFELDLQKTKEDYHSQINYKFILSPVSNDGGFAYLSPSTGLAVNKNSKHLDWSLEFLDFFFSDKINKEFAKNQGCMSNTKDALINFDVKADHISTVGEVTFSYAFYKTVTTLLLNGYSDMVGISKLNAKKYMQIDFFAVNNDYIQNHTEEKYYYLVDENYKTSNPSLVYYKRDNEIWAETTNNYFESNSINDLYRAEFSIKYTLEEYMDRLEQEFQKIKAQK